MAIEMTRTAFYGPKGAHETRVVYMEPDDVQHTVNGECIAAHDPCDVVFYEPRLNGDGEISDGVEIVVCPEHGREVVVLGPEVLEINAVR